MNLVKIASKIRSKNAKLSNILKIASFESKPFYFLAKVANALDEEGDLKVSNAIDLLLKSAAEKKQNNLYDSDASRAKSLISDKNDKRKDFYYDVPYEGLRMTKNEGLSTRYSPDYPGVSLVRLEDGVYQDSLNGKVYDFNLGWTSEKGQVFTGGSVADQTPAIDDRNSYYQTFDDRQSRERTRL